MMIPSVHGETVVTVSWCAVHLPLSRLGGCELAVGGLLGLLHEPMQEHHRRVTEAEEHPVNIPVERRPHLVEAAAEGADQRSRYGPPPLDLLDVRADLLADGRRQRAQPFPYGLLTVRGLVECTRYHRLLRHGLVCT